MTENASASRGGVVQIPLSRGFVALIDESDLPIVQPYRWHALVRRGVVYAGACPQKTERVLMHRLLTGAGKGVIVDHANHNGLDNRRSNLRMASQAQNQGNQRVQKTGRKVSKFKGVSANRASWYAEIQVRGKRYRLGCFQTEEDAARAYDQAAQAAFGEFACTNDNMGLLTAA